MQEFPFEISNERIITDSQTLHYKAILKITASLLNKWIIKMIPVLVIGSIVILICIRPEETKEFLTEFLDWLSRHRFIGPFVLCVALAVATVLLLPGTIVTLGTGVALMKAYKSAWLAVLVGSLSVFIGTWLGSILAMLIARYLFRE